MNNNTKHTPGPWRFAGPVATHIPHGNYPVIVDVPQPHGMSIEEWEANKALVESAPELLEALESLAAEEYRDDDDPILGMARAKARAAIAKARGQA